MADVGEAREGAARRGPSAPVFRPIAQARSPDLAEAVSACDFPLVVWVAPEAVITLANEAAGELLGYAVEDLVGRSLYDLRLPRSSSEQIMASITSDYVDHIRSSAFVVRSDGEVVPTVAWTRAIEVDGRRGGVTLATRRSEVSRLGRDLTVPWRSLVPIAIGTLDPRWRIETVTADITEITGRPPAELEGHPLTDLVHPDDRHRLTGTHGEHPRTAASWCDLRLRGHDDWVDGGVLVSPSPEGRLWFAVIGRPRPLASPHPRRVAELELRLRHIAAEVRAAGVLESLAEMPSTHDVPELGELSIRQWEIVSRLASGQRVGAIAEALFVSPSTVRNHLSAVFSKFGVHTQSDLLERLRHRGPPGRN